MGFNISGIVINQNFKDHLEQLSGCLKLELVPREEITFEEASQNWKREGCDIYFSEKGTLLFLPMDMCNRKRSCENLEIMTFVYSEMSMVFYMNYSNGSQDREIAEVEGARNLEDGPELDIEADAGGEVSEIIIRMISKILGEDFWDIDLSGKALRCNCKPLPC